MARRRASSIAVLLALAPWLSSQATPVRVYRCTAADGAVSLQDAPCPKDADEELRTLRRPVDAPAPTAPAPAPSSPAAPMAEVMPPPLEPVAPLYDCFVHDGTRYESATGVGESRWVPSWVLGLDPAAPRRSFVRTGATPAPPRDAPRTPLRAPDPAALGPGAWVQDACFLLSPDAACARRRERLLELRRERKDAQANARDRLRLDADALAAQLARECG